MAFGRSRGEDAANRRCSGSGQAPGSTYETSQRGSGGVVRRTQVATCGADPNHRDLPTHGGRVQPHTK